MPPSCFLRAFWILHCILFLSAAVNSVCWPRLPCHSKSNSNPPHVARQWTVKKGKKNSTSWSRPVARCSELSRKLCFFCNRETRFVEEQKEGECAYSALLQLSVLYPGSEVLWCEIHWNFHGLWVWMRPHTFHIHESIIAIIHFIMSSRSPLQVYYFFFLEATALRLAHIVTLKVDYQTDFARTWSRSLQHRFGSRRKCDSWQRARF